MISRITLTLISCCFVFVTGVQAAPLKTDKQIASYIVGYKIAADMKVRGVDLDPAAVAQAIRDANRKKKPALTDAQLKRGNLYIRKRMIARQKEITKLMNARAAKNKKAGAAFLAKNRKAKGVKTTSSGLQYIVVREGSGAKPKPTDEVIVHYKGTFINGKIFDSTYVREKPAKFQVGNVIKGWQEALQLMKKGGKLKVFIPSKLAYGVRGRPGIEPNQVLIFDMELIDIRKPKS